MSLKKYVSILSETSNLDILDILKLDVFIYPVLLYTYPVFYQEERRKLLWMKTDMV